MLTIKNYLRPKTPQEAYDLVQKRSNVILGGMLWLKMQNRRVDTAIDLQDLGLSYIRQEEDGVHIGAMTSLRTLETSPILNELTQGAAAEAVKPIVGVQFRNCATVGGSLYGRFGFSDVLTLFLAWDAQVVLYGAGRMPLSQFVQIPRSRRDLLLEVIVSSQPVQASYQSQRNSATDFPVLACCVMKRDGAYRCCLGARPGAARCYEDETHILQGNLTEEKAETFARWVSEQAAFGSNMRGSEAYRRRLAETLVRRSLLALGKE